MSDKYIDLTKTNDDIPNIPLEKINEKDMQNDDVSDDNYFWIDSDSHTSSMDTFGSDTENNVYWDVNSVPTIDMLWSNDNDF